MKRYLLFAALLMLAAAAQAQVNNPGVRYVSSAPSGACSQSPPVQVLNSSGAIYTCNNGTWATSGDGSGTVSPGRAGQLGYYSADGSTIGGITTNIVYATAYGVKADGVSIHDASTSNGSPIVTCPNSDCHFSSADIGKIIFGTNATYDATEGTSTVILARSTILSIGGVNSITVSNNATADRTADATVIYGDLDSAAYGATQSTANDPLLRMVRPPTPLVFCPTSTSAGMMIVEQPGFLPIRLRLLALRATLISTVDVDGQFKETGLTVPLL